MGKAVYDLFLAIPSFPAVVHVRPDPHDLEDSVLVLVPSFLDHLGDLLELGVISLLLRGQKLKAVEKRNHVLDDGIEVVDFVIPHPVRSAPECSAMKPSLVQGQDDLVLLRDVETHRDFPWNGVVVPRAIGNVEASFAVGKPGEIITHARGNGFNI